MYIYICICMYVRIYIHTYIHIHMVFDTKNLRQCRDRNVDRDDAQDHVLTLVGLF